MDVLKNTLEKAKTDAILDAKNLNMELSEIEMTEILKEVSLTKIDSFEEDDPGDEEVETHDNDVNNKDFENISEELNSEMSSEINIFSNMKSLNIKDYTAKKNNSDPGSDPSLLTILVNNKTMLVKKSTLCWLFSEKKNNLSTDRLHRVRGMTRSKKDNPPAPPLSIPRLLEGKKRKKNTMTRYSTSDSDTSADADTSSVDVTENDAESSSEEELEEAETNITISVEKYYAAFYDTWYLGRIVESLDDHIYKMKFLKSELDQFVWPKKPDIQEINKKFIFYGPISLLGSGPFRLKRQEKINIEKALKNFIKNDTY